MDQLTVDLLTDQPHGDYNNSPLLFVCLGYDVKILFL